MKKLMMPVAGLVVLLSSCVSSKKFKQAQDDYTVLNNKYTQLQEDLKSCEKDLVKASNFLQTSENNNANLKEQLKTYKDQASNLQSTNTQVLGRLEDLSVLSSKQAESVQQSLAKLAERDIYIKDLQGAMARKDSLNMALVMNLKGSLGPIADDDINIEVDKGVVYINISDKLLFTTGSYDVNPKAMNVLEKVATVLKNQPNIEFMVEGHTDNVPIKGGALRDNWDLSVLRATSVVRTLQTKFGIDPKRMTAGGRAEYVPVMSNSSASGKAANRRTRIVVLPELDQFFQLLNPGTTAEKPAGK
ncbi:MAG: OmpA family protein [Bacteroidetes bacterium]|uniref:OmpA family protein n=1 Tax=Phnomibacter sp. TaxID=2836217 RepID=UPI002FDE7392|nr:OmpA family protein [Bacteroidota bacterium]